MKGNVDPRNNMGHRWTRGKSHVDVVDVHVADHPAPSIEERMRRMDMVKIAGGTQALKRTANYRLKILSGETTTISVPQPFGALVLKAAAYKNDSRDRDRHLNDAAVLLACIDDPFVEKASFAGSDLSRLLLIQDKLVSEHAAWRRMPREDRQRAQQVLRVLCATD